MRWSTLVSEYAPRMWICQTHVLTKYYQGEVYLPTNAAQTKIDKLRAMIGDNKNIELKFHAEDCVEVFFFKQIRFCCRTHWKQTEMEARRQGKVKDLPFISPYNDLEIVAGQGTIGVEIVEQFKKFEPDQGNFAFNVKKKKKSDDSSSCLVRPLPLGGIRPQSLDLNQVPFDLQSNTLPNELHSDVTQSTCIRKYEYIRGAYI